MGVIMATSAIITTSKKLKSFQIMCFGQKNELTKVSPRTPAFMNSVFILVI